MLRAASFDHMASHCRSTVIGCASICSFCIYPRGLPRPLKNWPGAPKKKICICDGVKLSRSVGQQTLGVMDMEIHAVCSDSWVLFSDAWPGHVTFCMRCLVSTGANPGRYGGQVGDWEAQHCTAWLHQGCAATVPFGSRRRIDVIHSEICKATYRYVLFWDDFSARWWQDAARKLKTSIGGVTPIGLSWRQMFIRHRVTSTNLVTESYLNDPVFMSYFGAYYSLIIQYITISYVHIS